jgi:N-acetyl sugar amidotransferase
MDTTDPDIRFDESGICNHCTSALQKLTRKPYALTTEEKKRWFSNLVQQIKKDGEGKQYDCIIGVSGGVDSTYVAYLVKNAGLRPLAVHLDNGWNSELSVMNIKNICHLLSIDLYTEVLDWIKFRDLQLSFFKASTPDLEIPSDHAIFATLYKMANQYGVKYILSGSNLATESILPILWSYGHYDWRYIKNVNSRFGSKENIKRFPHFSITKFFYYKFIKKIQWISTLDYVHYDKEEAKQIIGRELNWSDYGGKHHESIITKFLQSYILVKKFNIDKRKAHLSAQIVSGIISRNEALKELMNPLYKSESDMNNEVDYFCKKFGLPDLEFTRLMELKPKSFYSYKSYYNSWVGKNLICIYKRLKSIK